MESLIICLLEGGSYYFKPRETCRIDWRCRLPPRKVRTVDQFIYVHLSSALLVYGFARPSWATTKQDADFPGAKSAPPILKLLRQFTQPCPAWI